MDHNIGQDPRQNDPKEQADPQARDRDQGAIPRANSERDSRIREFVREGRKVYVVSPEAQTLMFDIGRFRTIDTQDMAGFQYAGRESQMRCDIHSLKRQGLIQTKTVWTGRNRETPTYLTLTKDGKRFLKHQDLADGQAVYSGFVKPAELRHDAGIYHMFRREASKIEQAGGRVRRVVLDYELKKRAYSPLAKAKLLSPEEYTKRQAEIAQENGLKVVNGHIVLPDLRIEYEDRNGIAAQVDLEVASDSYHGSHAAEKAAAGFRIYAPPDVAAKLSRALEEREITAEIFYL
jgi:hypothetical protein